MSKDICNQLKNVFKNFLYFSVALDESLDISDMPQFCIFIRGVTYKFEVYEELLGLVPLNLTTKSIDICNALCFKMNEFKLNIDKIASITTDGAPAMIGKRME